MIMAESGSICSFVLDSIFQYYTPRIVQIKSKKVGFINRLLQLAIISYIIGFVLVYKKGYQEFDTVTSAVTTKLKGIALSDFPDLPDIGRRTWDAADYVIPPQENSAVFVMTNILPTMNQTQSTCPEDPTVSGSICSDDSYCRSQKGTILDKGNGPFTGKCVESTNGVDKVCEIYGWCHVENTTELDYLNQPVLSGSQNFTLFIKNNIEFSKFGVKRRNILDFYANDSELSNCRWSRKDEKSQYCPIFVLSDIVSNAGENYDDLTMKGGVIQIIIDWTCNLDLSVDDCLPEYSFRRLDRGNYSISKGFNFRYANYYGLMMENGTFKQYRNLYKVTGIIFVITVEGKAGKFNIVPLFLNFGSGLALLTITTIICDIIVLYILKAKYYYRERKYLQVEDEDEIQILGEDSSIGQGTGVMRHHTPSVGSFEGHQTDT